MVRFPGTPAAIDSDAASAIETRVTSGIGTEMFNGLHHPWSGLSTLLGRPRLPPGDSLAARAPASDEGQTDAQENRVRHRVPAGAAAIGAGARGLEEPARAAGVVPRHRLRDVHPLERR